MHVSTRFIVGLLLPLCLAACAAPIGEQKRAGFLSDYAKLALVEKNAYRYTNPDIANYQQLIIEPPVFLLDDMQNDGEPMFSDDDLEKISAYIQERLHDELTDDERFEIVRAPGPGVARVRVALTAIDASQGLLNVSLYTKVTGAGLGGAAMEAELVDSVTNEQLSATVQWGNDSRFLRAGLSRTGGVKLQSRRWIKNLRKRIEEADAQAQ